MITCVHKSNPVKDKSGCQNIRQRQTLEGLKNVHIVRCICAKVAKCICPHGQLYKKIGQGQNLELIKIALHRSHAGSIIAPLRHTERQTHCKAQTIDFEDIFELFSRVWNNMKGLILSWCVSKYCEREDVKLPVLLAGKTPCYEIAVSNSHSSVSTKYQHKSVLLFTNSNQELSHAINRKLCRNNEMFELLVSTHWDKNLGIKFAKSWQIPIRSHLMLEPINWNLCVKQQDLDFCAKCE